MSLLTEMGYLVRGSVTIGNIITDENLIFGPALVRAYADLENKLAKWPRVVVDPDTQNELLLMTAGRGERYMWDADEDDAHVLDYMYCQGYSSGDIQRIRRRYERKFRNSNDESIRDKLKYMLSSLRRSMKKAKNDPYFLRG
jgi:hypothetical protein